MAIELTKCLDDGRVETHANPVGHLDQNAKLSRGLVPLLAHAIQTP